MNDQSVSPYDGMIAHLRAQREKIDQAITILESIRDGVAISTEVTPGAVTLTGHTRDGEIAAGTFHGMSIEEATRKLLQHRKRTLGVREITNSLRAGGLHLQSETPENTVASVISRAFNSGSDIVRVSRGQWGLQEWYPNQRFNRRGED